MAKKRVLIVNKFLYPRGGDCIVALTEAELLRSAGHEVEMWGMDYPENLQMSMTDIFATQVKFDGSLPEKLKAVTRMMGFGDIRSSFSRALARFRPDVVHFHNIHSYLSPVIVGMAKNAGARTLWTMHDYKLICPAYTCMDSSGCVCTSCVKRPGTVLEKRCMKGSRLQSAAAYAEARRWNLSRLSAMTDRFICPGQFMAARLRESGLPEEKLIVVNNFLDPEKVARIRELPVGSKRDSRRILYVGRLSAEKGVEPMIREFMAMPDDFTLRIVGSGPEEEKLRGICRDDRRIEFCGWKSSADVMKEMVSAGVMVCPSIWFENKTISVMEALACGTPVLVSDVGSLPDMVDASNGMTYNPNRRGEFANALRTISQRSFDHQAISSQALGVYSSDAHLKLLETLF